MSMRWLALFVLAAAPAGAQSYAYTPGTQRYRIEIATQNQRDQNGGRAPAEFNYTTTQVVTVQLTRQSRDTLALTVTIDSINQESAFDAPKSDLSWARGTKLTGKISPAGQLYSFVPPSGSDANMRGLYDGFRFFLPELHTQIASGSAWADTTMTRSGRRGAFDSVLTQKIVNSKVTGDTTIAGQHAWRVDRSGSIELHGQGSEGGKMLRVAGDGTIRGVQYIGVGGVYLGSKVTQIMRMVESFPETGDGPASTQTIRSQIVPL
jgi:hypothetical protein